MKVALVLNDDFSMFHFRAGLIRFLIRQAHDVYVIVPQGNFKDKLEELGARCMIVDMHRFVSPLRDLLLIWQLYRVFRKHNFDIVHNMTIKPNIYGTVAAKLAGIPRIVCLVSGRGFMFANSCSVTDKLVRFPVRLLYRLAMKAAYKTWFQNTDDFDYFVTRRIVSNDKGIVIRGGGINTHEYHPSKVLSAERECLRKELGVPRDANCILMVAARMIWSKGVREFIEAAECLHDQHPTWFFILVCPQDPGSPDAVSLDYIKNHRLDRLIVVDSFRHDVRSFESISDIMVLPSYYPEGLPRSLLEGLAMAKPLVTTDHPGCREAVEDGKNGYLVPVRSSRELASRLDALMNDPEKRERFGRESRLKAEREFSEEIVVKRIVRELYEIPGD